MSLAPTAADIGCRNEKGNIVEWYYIYKLPKKLEPGMAEDDPNGSGVGSDGLDYLYISSESSDGLWKTTSLKIDSPESISGQTISPLYNNEVSITVCLYSYNLNGVSLYFRIQ